MQSETGAARLAAAAARTERKARHAPAHKSAANDEPAAGSAPRYEEHVALPPRTNSGPEVEPTIHALEQPGGRDAGAPEKRFPGAIEPAPAPLSRPGTSPPHSAMMRGLVPLSIRTVDEPELMPESLRKSIRGNIITTLRGVNAAYRQVDLRQRELMTALIDAREHGFPRSEIDRIRGEAAGLGFHTEEFDYLLRATGWQAGQ